MPSLPGSWKTRWKRLTVCSLLSALFSIIVVCVFWQVRSLTALEQRPQLWDGRVLGGSLVIAGGGVVTPEVRERFVELAGGPKARIVLIPADEPEPGDNKSWLAAWASFDVKSIEVFHATNREKANDPQFCAPLAQATGVWFGGGRQLKLAVRYVGTGVQQCLKDLLARNGVVGGSSAGAAILSNVIIAAGDNDPLEGRGLDLISDVIVDQHFLRRNRVWRLQQVLARHAELTGLGIDEQTALVVHLLGRRLHVIGKSYVIACVPGAEANTTRFEVLKPGDRTSLDELRLQHLPQQPYFDSEEVAGPH